MPDPAELYHRLESPSQTPADAKLQHTTGELWGRANRNSDRPSADAYRGPLPPGARGIEFTTGVEPDAGTPPHRARWTGPRSGVIIREGFAIVPIRVTSNTQG